MTAQQKMPSRGRVIFSPLEERVDGDIHKMVFANARVGILGGALALLGVFLIDWDATREVTNLWCLMMSFCLFGRLVALLLQWRQDGKAFRSGSPVPFRMYYTASVIEGLVWGSSMFFLWSSDPLYQAFLMIVLVGVAVGAMAVFSGSMSLYAIYATSIIALTSFKLVSLNLYVYNILGGLTWVLLMALLVVAHRMNSLFLNMMRLSIKNEQLAMIEAASKQSIVDFSKKLSVKTSEVERVTKRLKHLITVLSHDLRTQLVTLFQFSGYLGNDRPSQYDNQFVIDTLKQSASKSMRLVDDLVDVTGVEPGIMALDLLSGPIHESVEKVIQQTQKHAAERGVNLFMAVDEQRLVKMDAKRIEDVLSGLMEKAVNHSQRNGAVTVQTTPTVRGLRVEIIDTGQSEAEDRAHNLSERQHDISEMALLQEIIRAHDSQIEVENNPTTGCCYSFTLPWART